MMTKGALKTRGGLKVDSMLLIQKDTCAVVIPGHSVCALTTSNTSFRFDFKKMQVARKRNIYDDLMHAIFQHLFIFFKAI